MTKSQLIEESRNQYITFQSGDVKCDSQFNEPMVLLPIKAFESRLSLIYDKAVEEMREKNEVKMKEIDRCARVLQKSFCGYSTTEGDEKICDCKFAFDVEKQEYKTELDTWKGNSECTGCAEARQIIWNVRDLLSTLTPKGEK